MHPITYLILAALLLPQQDSISVVNSARPLADAVQQLEAKYGVRVFYEDPTWTAAQFPNLGGRPPVYRTYNFAVGFDPSQPIVSVLGKVLDQASAEGIPGNFTVVTIGDGNGIIPTEGSPLDLPISFPSAERTADATFQIIIVRLLNDMRWRSREEYAHSDIPKMSWSMLYDPYFQGGSYFVNVRSVRLGQELVPQSPEYSRLYEARDKWVTRQIIRYEFTYTQICLCPSPQTPGWEPVVFRVTNRVGSAITGQRAFDASQFSTVEKQFVFIQEQLEKHPRRVHIEYDPDDGHPTNVYFGTGITTDGDYGFTISNFTPLPLNDSPVTPAGQKEK